MRNKIEIVCVAKRQTSDRLVHADSKKHFMTYRHDSILHELAIKPGDKVKITIEMVKRK